uniref:hypothetical protein n=1 Tax=Trichocoleus desertorum TaxID=1481672 RepID=UPI0025B2A55F|nr:hypothetical protein [Trichocoleus desertorum]
MSVQVQTQRMGRFIDPWPYLTLATAVVMLLGLINAGFVGKTLLATSLNVDPEEAAELQPIQVEKTPIGALRIETEAIVPDNHWVTYEIQLRDRQGNLLASGIKQAWNESGTWSEEGESGTWQESDLSGGLDVRPNQSEPITIAIQVLDYTSTSGQEIDQPVPITVTVQNGVVDGRYLWAGLIGTASLALLSLIAVPLTGAQVIEKTIPDSDVGDRGVMGGSDRLVRVTVDITSDETSPEALQVELFVKDQNGEQIYTNSFPVNLSLSKENGKVDEGTGTLTLFFLLEPRSSYGFYAEVVPDGPIDKTTLAVRDGAKTLGLPEVIHLKTT